MSYSQLPSPPGTEPRPKAWHEHITLDLLIRILHRTFLHPFIAWLVPLCLRAQVTPYTHPSFILTTAYATLLTLYFIASGINHRIAYGRPRDVDLNDEVIVVTGGASGLGQLIAEVYGLRGASVAVLDVRPESEVGEFMAAAGVEYYQCDVSAREEVERTARRITMDLGPATILINCAAASINGRPLISLSTEAITKTIQTNLLAPFHTMQVFLPELLAAENGGTIVTVSSIIGQLTAAGLSDYSASKAGLSALHRTLEAELRVSGDGERVKTLLVETGQMDTPLFGGVETPSPFFAPVLEPSEVAREIVNAVDAGIGGVIRLPAFAAFTSLYGILPASVQRIARYIGGIDVAIAKSTARRQAPEIIIENPTPIEGPRPLESDGEIVELDD